jgi:hypothetical protein
MSVLRNPSTLDDLERRFGRLAQTFATAWRQAGGGTGQALDDIKQQLQAIEGNIDKIMATQAEDAQELRNLKQTLIDVSTQLTKASDEILAKIAALIAAAQNADVSTELQAAIDDLKPAGDALKPIAQAMDDIVPDNPPV